MIRWLRDLHQTLSYKIGYGYGSRGLTYRCPWWADVMVCGLGYIDGRKAGAESMAKSKKPPQWRFAVNCPRGHIVFIGAARSQTDAARAQKVFCPKCENETSYKSEDIWTTDKAPK